eukprot:COSAG02_NODE_1794_length_10913_cov_4.900592_7_plen_205_part_00
MRDALRSRRPWRASACRMLRNLTFFNLTASFDWCCCICYVYCVCCRCCCRSCGTECQRRIRRWQSDLAEPSLQHRPGSEQGRRFLQLLVRWRCWQSYPAASRTPCRLTAVTHSASYVVLLFIAAADTAATAGGGAGAGTEFRTSQPCATAPPRPFPRGTTSAAISSWPITTLRSQSITMTEAASGSTTATLLYTVRPVSSMRYH